MSSLAHKIKTMISTPRIFWIKFAHSPLFRYLPDKTALEIQFQKTFHRKIDWDDPKTFNEKLQWLKLYDRKPEYTTMVDKYAAKAYAASIIGEEHIIPTLGVWDQFDDIDFDKLPDQFVLKCTHGSGDIVICRDKQNFDYKMTREKFNKALQFDYFKVSREWPYKNVPRMIIAEQYMDNKDEECGVNGGINDYKFFCFNGEPKIMFVATDRATDCRFDYFDMDFKHLAIDNIHANSDHNVPRPSRFEEMKTLASKLSRGHSFMRVDLYQINGQVYFGEFTFFHASGFSTYNPEEWDYKMGEWLQLPEKHA